MKTPNAEDILHSLGLTRLEPEPAYPDWVAPVAIFSLGALTGAAAAVLLTPKSGPELRKDIARTASDVTDTVAAKLPDLPAPIADRFGGNEKAHVEIEAK